MYIVYKHTCPNGKVYIGITSNYARRCVPSNYKHNIRWTRAINKYGWKDIKHEILFENLTKEEACQKEIELIALHKSTDQRFGYNVNLGGNIPFSYGKHLSKTHKQNIARANTGKVPTEAAREKNRQAHLGKSHTEETRQKMILAHKGKHTGANNGMYGKNPWNKGKKIALTPEQFDKVSKAHTKIMILYQYTLEGELLNTFSTYEEATRATGVPKRSIANNVCGHQKSAYGFIFTKERLNMKQLSKRSKELVSITGAPIYVLLQAYKCSTMPLGKISNKFTCIFKENDGKLTYLTFDTELAAKEYFELLTDDNIEERLKAAKKELKIIKSSISKKDKFRSFSVVCLETNHCYASARDAERHTGVSHSSIIRVCHGKRKTAGGMHWQFYNEI